jgi:hypothetical protein
MPDVRKLEVYCPNHKTSPLRLSKVSGQTFPFTCAYCVYRQIYHQRDAAGTITRIQ